MRDKKRWNGLLTALLISGVVCNMPLSVMATEGEETPAPAAAAEVSIPDTETASAADVVEVIPDTADVAANVEDQNNGDPMDQQETNAGNGTGAETEEISVQNDMETEEAGSELPLEEQANSEVAVETWDVWEASLPQILKHTKADVRAADFRADIVAIANSQVGYTETVSNDMTVKASRYGAWAGDPYATPWDAEFVDFVLNYAGIPNAPRSMDTAVLAQELQAAGVYFAPTYEAEAGDIVFLMEPDGRFRVGILVDINENEITVVGEENGIVARTGYNRTDTRIFAYGVVVQPTAADLADAALTAENIRIEATLQAAMYTDAAENEELYGTSITVEGLLPENAAVCAWPVIAELDDEQTFAAYQIVIFDENGNEYHSEEAGGAPITVTIYNEELTAKLQAADHIHCWHKENDGNETSSLEYSVLEDGGVQFSSNEF